MPYGRKQERIVRIANFIGSTNNISLLKESSNVRWLIFDIQSIDFSYNKIDINKIWSQAYYLAYEDKEFNPELSSEELELMMKRIKSLGLILKKRKNSYLLSNQVKLKMTLWLLQNYL